MDLRQSPAWQKFMQKSGWQVDKFKGGVAYTKKFGPFGSFTKIQRPDQIPPKDYLRSLAQKYHCWQILIEPSYSITLNGLSKANPYLAPKTIQIKLGEWDENKLPKKNRYAIKKAAQYGVSIHTSDRVEQFIDLWKSTKTLALRQDQEIRSLYASFARKNRFVCLSLINSIIVAGCLVLIFDKVAYYMYAATNKKGRATSAQYLAVVEVIEESRQRGAKIFDFEGIYDSRYHKQTKSWQGFTRFKKSFGGQELEFPPSYKFNYFWGYFN